MQNMQKKSKKSKAHKSKIKTGEMRKMWSGDFLFEQYPDAILIVNDSGRIEDSNRMLLDMFGYTKSEIVGKTMEVLMPKKYRAKHVGQRHEHLKSQHGREIGTGIKFEAERKDGTRFPLDIMLAPLETESGKITVSVIRDISEKKKAEERVRNAKDTLKAVMDSAPVAIFVLNKKRVVVSWSQAAEALFGYKAKEVLGKPYKLLPKGKKSSRDCKSILEKAFEGESVQDTKGKRLHKDGSLIDVSISAAPMYNKDNKVYAAAFSAQNISDRIAQEKKLHQLAFFDRLTGLPNKAHLQSNILKFLSSNNSKPLAIAAIELSGISEINNTLGQSTGELFLKEITKRLKAVAGSRATLYRTCSSEFYVTIPIKDDPCIVIDILREMFKKLNDPIEINNHSTYIKANAGITIAPMHGENVEDIFANTHLSLQVAKSDSNCNYKLFETSYRDDAQKNLTLNIELRKAFENDEFELFYQPQTRLSNGELIGAEALIRWHHPKKGLVQPDEFIEALSKKPIAHDVGKWIMLSAAKQAMKWRENGFPDFRIGVNLFEAQFKADTIEADVEAVLKETGLPANALELEITENISHGSDDEIIKSLARLKEKGVHIAFDDFGTGYASLSYLVKYPLSRIKIDKSFLENIPFSKEDSAIVHSTIVMAHALGLEVIAEGVETPEHILFLGAQNCEEAQGYYYSKPVDADKFFEYAKSTLTDKQPKTCCPSDEKQAS